MIELSGKGLNLTIWMMEMMGMIWKSGWDRRVGIRASAEKFRSPNLGGF
ncbi:MAG: hypothetical protein H7070_08560 [Saprospiraceae bacterium]|nr:hypothetical protein [Pyrinomonadaceae bacterium]